MDAAGGFAGAFPRPEETRAARQLPLQDHVLLVVVITLAFTRGVGHLDQTLARVVAVAGHCLFGAPGVRLGPAALKHLIVDGHQVLEVITQQQGTIGAVVQALNPFKAVPLHRQAVVVGVADHGQSAVAEMKKTRHVAGLGEDQFARFVAEVNRRPRQSVTDQRARRRRPWKWRASVFGVDPQHLLAVEFQMLAQRVPPAETEPAVEFDGTGAIEAGEVERQDPVEGAVRQCQRYFTGNHGHRAVVGGRALKGIDAGGEPVRLCQGTAGGTCQYLLGIEHLQTFAWRNVGRETLRRIFMERSRESWRLM